MWVASVTQRPGVQDMSAVSFLVNRTSIEPLQQEKNLQILLAFTVSLRRKFVDVITCSSLFEFGSTAPNTTIPLIGSLIKIARC